MDENKLQEQYFGPAHRRKEWERQIATPVGRSCLICTEAIAEGDCGTISLAGQVTHYECSMRLVIGSVAHQLKRCSCFGGAAEEDEPSTSYRTSAIAATALWESMQAAQPDPQQAD